MHTKRWMHSCTKRRKVQQITTTSVSEEPIDIEVVSDSTIEKFLEVMDQNTKQALDKANTLGSMSSTTSLVFQTPLSKINPSKPTWFNMFVNKKMSIVHVNVLVEDMMGKFLVNIPKIK